MNCKKGHEFREYERNCPVCDEHVGYPNVRAAEVPEEQRALARRLKRVEESATKKGCLDDLIKFREALKSSQAVLCRSLSMTLTHVSDDNQLYASFYHRVDAGVQRPKDTTIENERLLADDLLFPHYRKEIAFACLSLDMHGVTSYGKCSIVLNEDTIRQRASVFEENSVSFCRKHSFAPPIPLGYRATWAQRGDLSIAKLESRLYKGMKVEEFPDILLGPVDGSGEEDFVEVHIHGKLHRQGIERILVQETTHPPDTIYLREITRMMNEIGVEVDTYK